MRQQACLLKDPDGHGADVSQRVVIPVGIEPLTGLRPAILGAVSEGEERLLAALRRTCASNLQDFVRREVCRGEKLGDGHESAVVATVPTQTGQRDEDLARVRHDAGPAGCHHRRIADTR